MGAKHHSASEANRHWTSEALEATAETTEEATEKEEVTSMGYKVVGKHKKKERVVGYYPTKAKAKVKALKMNLLYHGKFTVQKTKRGKKR